MLLSETEQVMDTTANLLQASTGNGEECLSYTIGLVTAPFLHDTENVHALLYAKHISALMPPRGKAVHLHPKERTLLADHMMEIADLKASIRQLKADVDATQRRWSEEDESPGMSARVRARVLVLEAARGADSAGRVSRKLLEDFAAYGRH